MKQIFFIMMLLTAMVACQNNAAVTEQAAEETTVETQEQDTVHFGAMIEQDGAISFEEMMAQLEGQDSIEVKVTGRVDAVCQAKGCWMNIVSTNPDMDTMFVKFLDYGFFVPKHIAGRTVVMQGKAYREVTSVDELRHYAEDEGKSAEEIALITEPVEELKFMATGVILVD